MKNSANLPSYCWLANAEEKLALLANQLASEVNEHLAVVLADAAEEKNEALKVTSGVALEAPVVMAVGGLNRLRESGSFGRGFTVIEKQVEGDVERESEFFKRGKRRNGAAVLKTGDIRALQTSALFDVSLGQVLLLADGPQTLGKNHGVPLPNAKFY